MTNKSPFKLPLNVIVLAAGKGTRMKSPLPKVAHPVAGQPMIQRIVNQAKSIGAHEVRVVVGYGEELVRQLVEPLGGICKKQHQQNGTADAVKAADPSTLSGMVLIVNGDHPLITSDDLVELVKKFEVGNYDVAVVSSKLKNPKSYGRIVRSGGKLHSIVEAKDASHEALKINEVNTGIYVARAEVLSQLLPRIQNHNQQQEYYLTDIIELCKDDGGKVGAIEASPRVCFGVNSQRELAKATQILYKRKALQLLDEGVMVVDPNHTYIEESVQVGEACVIYPGVMIRGACDIGNYCVVESNCVMSNVTLESGVVVKAMSHLEGCVVREKAELGPYARIRPDSDVGPEARIGNFVELKKAKMGKGAKAGHLTYLGDAEIGQNVNIGCGTITCNYAADRKKYKTIIGDDAFVGSDTQFIAPITIGRGAIIGSGSTITKDVPDKALAIARGRQVIRENYKPKSPKQTDKARNSSEMEK